MTEEVTQPLWISQTVRLALGLASHSTGKGDDGTNISPPSSQGCHFCADIKVSFLNTNRQQSASGHRREKCDFLGACQARILFHVLLV